MDDTYQSISRDSGINCDTTTTTSTEPRRPATVVGSQIALAESRELVASLKARVSQLENERHLFESTVRQELQEQVRTSASFLTELSVGSPRKLFIFVI